MGFSNGSWAKAWEVKPNNKYTDVRISTSRKDRQSGEYQQDYSGYVRLVGEAHKKAADMQNGDRFQMTSCSVESNYDKDKKVTYYNFLVFDIELSEDGDTTGRAQTNVPVQNNTAAEPAEAEEENEDEMPF